MDGLYGGKIRGYANFSTITGHSSGDITEDSILSLVTVLGSSISLVGLVFAFITYSLFSDLRNLSGTALMNFLAALFMSQLLYVIGAGGVQDDELCIGLAFSLQYMRLTVFCWMFVMSHHMYRTFCDGVHLLSASTASSIRSAFWRYSIFGWCSPGVFLGVSLALESGGKSFAELRTSNCWFASPGAFLFGYAVPVVLLLVAIVAILIRSALVVKETAIVQVEDDKSRERLRRKRRLQLVLYVKLTLFISAVALLSVLYVSTRVEAFWILFNVFQGVQGIVVALCVTCNCQILKIFTRSLKKHRKRSEYGGVAKDAAKSTSLQMLTWEQPTTPDSV